MIALQPPIVELGLFDYPANPVADMKAAGTKVVAFDATIIAQGLGDIRPGQYRDARRHRRPSALLADDPAGLRAAAFPVREKMRTQPAGLRGSVASAVGIGRSRDRLILQNYAKSKGKGSRPFPFFWMRR